MSSILGSFFGKTPAITDIIEQIQHIPVSHITNAGKVTPTMMLNRTGQLSAASYTPIDHEVFDLTVEELRAVWIVRFGTGWVRTDEELPISENPVYFELVFQRLSQFAELEYHMKLDHTNHVYERVYRIKQ